MGDTPTGKIVAAVVPGLILAIGTVHGPQPAEDRRGDRDDHLRDAAGHARPRRRPGLRPRRPRRRLQDAQRRVRLGQRNKDEVKRDLEGQGPRRGPGRAQARVPRPGRRQAPPDPRPRSRRACRGPHHPPRPPGEKTHAHHQQRVSDLAGPERPRPRRREASARSRTSTSTARPASPSGRASRRACSAASVSFAPLAEATPLERRCPLPYDKALVKDAPNVEADGELSQRGGGRLYRHYGHELRRPLRQRPPTTATAPDAARPSAATRPGPTTDDAMTRSEEELHVGTRLARDRPRAPAQVRRDRGRPDDGARSARGGPHRARADHRRQRRRRARRPGDLRGGARGHAPRRGACRREARRAQGARAPRQGHGHRGAQVTDAGPPRADRGRGRP